MPSDAPAAQRRPLSFVKIPLPPPSRRFAAESEADAFPSPVEEPSVIAQIFNASPAAREFLTSDASGETTLDGVATTFSDVRVRLARSSAVPPTPAPLADALLALQRRASRFAPPIDFASDEALQEGWRILSSALETSNAPRAARLFVLAEEEFLRTSGAVAKERPLCSLLALVAAALAQSYCGDFPAALATLANSALRSCAAPDDAPQSDDYWAFLRFQIEVRDYLSQLNGGRILTQFWREQAQRFQRLANSPAVDRQSAPRLRQAFDLYVATALLSSDLEAGVRELKAVSRGADPALTQDASDIYESIFGDAAPAFPARRPGTSTRLETASTAGERAKFAVRGVKFRFRYCPPGAFLMGSPETEPRRQIDERRRAVTLTQGFWILETPVTQRMWSALLGADLNPSSFSPNGADADDVAGLDASNLPVENVNWHDCRRFIQTLNSKKSLPSGFAFRLPTEAEWEYACRAGATDALAGAARLDAVAWNRANSEYRTREVQTKTPNAWGLSDMLGNVYEWCEDWFDHYPDVKSVDPRGPETGRYRVVRGGCWDSTNDECRCAARQKRTPSHRDNRCGFRLVFARVS